MHKTEELSMYDFKMTARLRTNIMKQRPIFEQKNFSFRREEKEGYISVRSTNLPRLQELFLNRTTQNILKKCNGSNTVEQIIRIISDMYPDIQRQVIANDVPPYGYMFKNEDKTVLHLDREVSGNVRFIFDKRLEGEKYSEIAKMMNEKGIETPTAYLLKKGYSLYNTQCLPVWNSHMVRKILLNPIYAGIMTNHKSEKKDLSTKSCVRLPRKDWIYVPGTHEAIVTADELDKVMGMVETGAAYHGPQKIPKNIFRYKLKCGYCGRALRVRSENKTPAMGCSTSKVSQNTKCYAGQYKTAEFEKLFLKLVQREAALAEDTLKQIKQVSKTQNLSKLKSRKKGCEEKVQKVKQQKMEFYEAFVDGKVTKEGYLRKKELLTQKEHRYKELITELQEQIIQAEEKRKLAKSPELLAFSKCKDLTELSYEVIQELVEVIYFYDPEHIEVIWKYRDEFLEAEKALAE